MSDTDISYKVNVPYYFIDVTFDDDLLKWHEIATPEILKWMTENELTYRIETRVLDDQFFPRGTRKCICFSSAEAATLFKLRWL